MRNCTDTCLNPSLLGSVHIHGLHIMRCQLKTPTTYCIFQNNCCPRLLPKHYCSQEKKSTDVISQSTGIPAWHPSFGFGCFQTITDTPQHKHIKTLLTKRVGLQEAHTTAFDNYAVFRHILHLFHD